MVTRFAILILCALMCLYRNATSASVSNFKQKYLLKARSHVHQELSDGPLPLRYVQRMSVKESEVHAAGPGESGTRPGRVCLTAGKTRYQPTACDEKTQPWTRVLPEETSVVETTSLPDNPLFLPEVGNGHVATVVGSDTIYMNGLYNGANTSSHRARIPSTAAVVINITSPESGWTTKYRMDYGTGVFSEIYTADDFTVRVNRYAHRSLTRLLVTEVLVNRTATSRPVTIAFAVNNGNASADIDFHQKGQGMMGGTTRIPEYSEVAGPTAVTVVYSTVLPNMTFDSIIEAYMPFITSVSHDQAEAIDYFNKGMDQMTNLLPTHTQAWSELWQQGRIDLEGNETMAITTTAALYFLLSSLPLRPDETWPFVGMAPGGLAHGNAYRDYHGHMFWDQDTWMFPPIALLHVDLGRIIVGSRMRIHDSAVLYANMTGFKGARYPWETAFTGLDVNPSNATTQYELHVTGDVSLMMRQYLQQTNDTRFLSQDGGYRVMADIADYWLSRFVFLDEIGQYGILSQMGPDEWNYPVNNSAYGNVIGALSLWNAVYASSLINVTAPLQWSKVASDVYVPFDPKRNFHPEYDNYTLGTSVKQADTILLGYPLQWPMSDQVHTNDLNYYASVTPAGPAMTWTAFSINWLRVGNVSMARDTFHKGIVNVQQPFKVWSENADGSGAYNFHTGIGGYLQSLLYGYAGFELYDQYLRLEPRLPPTITSVFVTGVDYAGNSVDLKYDVVHMNVTVTRGDNSLVLKLIADDREERLQVGVTVTAKCQLAQILRPAA